MNIQLRLILFFVSLILVSCKSEGKKDSIEQAYILSKQAMVEDYDIFQAIYRKANAGLYKYHTKTGVDSVFNLNKKRITKDLSYREFYNLLWNVIDYTGSCHNSLAYPEDLDEGLNKLNIFFPIPLKYIDNKLYTNIEHNTIPLGSEIISVNNIPQQEFSKRISKYISTDGFNTTGKYANISTDWLAFYIYLALGKQDSFTIQYRDQNTEIIKTQNIPSVVYADFYKNYEKRHSKVFENRKNNDYSYAFLDSINTGLLSVKTFAMGGPESEGHKAYATFLDSVFVTLKNQNTKTLIVDVRGNGGGNDPNDILLYSYLTQREFRENTAAFTIFQEVPFPEYYADDDIDELPDELKLEHSIFENGRYYQNDSFNNVWQPNKNAFNGKTIVLVDPFVASAGSLFASLVKSDENTIVIGEETLGGYYGHTGHIPVTYELPNSKFLLTFSIVDLEQDVKQLKNVSIGDGVIPDIRVVQSYNDFMNNTDNQLDVAIDIARRGH